MNEKPTTLSAETLGQLDIQEIEQRLEVSPLLATAEAGEVARGGHSCTCKVVPDPPAPENPYPPIGGD